MINSVRSPPIIVKYSIMTLRQLGPLLRSSSFRCRQLYLLPLFFFHPLPASHRDRHAQGVHLAFRRSQAQGGVP
jgi:hypothetical protein